MTVSAVILASGFSSRMGKNKLLIKYRGIWLVEHVFRAVSGSQLTEVIVVSVYEEILELACIYGFKAVHNLDPEIGQSHSVVLGTRQAASTDGLMFFNGDMPYLTNHTIARLLTAFEQQEGKKIIVPRYGGVNGSPVIFPADMRTELLTLSGDEGGRKIIRDHAGQVIYCDIEDETQGIDIDTPNDLKWLEGYTK